MIFRWYRERWVKVVPKPGYKAVTIAEEVYDQIIRSMEKFNTEAGVKRYRNISHFVEEAIVSFAVGTIKSGSESPEDIMKKVIEVMMNREDLLKSVFQKMIELPPEEASRIIQNMMTPEEIAHMKEICEKVEQDKGTRKMVKHEAH